jgi:hypothetical protein
MSTNVAANTIKCRYCNWTTPIWHTTKSGQTQSGYINLQHHVEDSHAELWSEIVARMQEADDELNEIETSWYSQIKTVIIHKDPEE